MGEITKIDSNKIFDRILEDLTNTLDGKCASFVKKFNNGYNKVCVIIPCLSHKDKFELVGDRKRVVSNFKKGNNIIIPEDNSVEFEIFDDFFIKEDCENKDTSTYKTFLFRDKQLPDDKNRNRHKEEKDVMFTGYRIWFKPYE